MIALWLVFAFMGVCAAALVVRPFLGREAEAKASDAKDAFQTEIKDIEASVARGDMDGEAGAAARIEAERRLLRAEEKAPPARAAAPANQRAALIIAALVLVGAGGLYAVTGRPDLVLPQPSAEEAAQAEFNQVVAGLEQKLKLKPNDDQGWRALGWAYFIEGKYDASVAAYQRAIALRGDVPAYHSAYGEALVGQAKGAVTTEALAQFERALALDPTDIRARFYVGLKKAQAGQAKAALDDWFAIYDEAPPGSDAAKELREQIEALAQQAHIDVSQRFAAPGPSAADVEGAAKLSDQERDAMIDAMVTTLDKRLRANPNDLDGWIRLIRARVVQKKPAEAADALARARAAFASDKRALQTLDQAAAEANLR